MAMDTKTYSIGQLARLSGMSVRRIRFYSDRGLLTPTGRTMSNYRLYTDVDVARIDLIRALRAAGVEMALISRVIERRLPLTDVLSARLEMLEGEIAAKRQIAAAIRATLRLPTPTSSDLRRLWTMMTLSNEQMHAKIKRVCELACEGLQDDGRWCRGLVRIRSCALPNDPSPEQIAAWEELCVIVDDEDLIDDIRAEAFWVVGDLTNGNDRVACLTDADKILRSAAAVWTKGSAPDSPEAKAIVRAGVHCDAKARRRDEAAMFPIYFDLHERSTRGRSTRFHELVLFLRGIDLPTDSRLAREFWDWRHQALVAIRPEFD